MKIAIGTKNPAKINAVKDAFKKMNLNIEALTESVKSEVSEMPLDNDEILLGAKNRAKNVYSFFKNKADYGIGIEGGIIKHQDDYYVRGWISIYNGKIYSNAGSLVLPFPKELGNHIFETREELGPLMDELMQDFEINKRQGSVGVMTNNVISRSHVFTDAIIAGFMEFHNTFFYKELILKFKELRKKY